MTYRYIYMDTTWNWWSHFKSWPTKFMKSFTPRIFMISHYIAWTRTLIWLRTIVSTTHLDTFLTTDTRSGHYTR